MISNPLDGLVAGFGIRRPPGIGCLLLGLAMIALGVRGLAFGDFAGVWQHVPVAVLPGRTFFVYACAVVELATGIGLLVRRSAAWSARVLAIYLLLWVVLLKLPGLVLRPQIEASWLGVGEIATILAGAWALAIVLAEPSKSGLFPGGISGMRGARLLLVLALLTIGLSHFVYANITAGYVPEWLPFRHGWAWLTGAANLAAAGGLLFAVWPRLAATLEAAMLSIITLLVWVPAVAGSPAEADMWSALLISAAIACGVWAMADTYRATA